MPAINPSRLRQQTNQLSSDFEHPDRFIPALRDLLNLYADRTHRPGQIGKKISVTPSYKVNKTVLDQIIKALSEDIPANPDLAIAISERLWRDNYFESKLVAAMILRETARTLPSRVLKLVDDWVTPKTDEELKKILLTETIEPIRNRAPELFNDRIANWLNRKEKFEKEKGLKALLGAAKDKNFVDYPMVFHSIQPLLREEFADIADILTDILWELAKITPFETTYFLNQTLLVTENAGVHYLIRQVLPALPAEDRIHLKKTIQEASHTE